MPLIMTRRPKRLRRRRRAVAVVGAGPAGLACAKRLDNAGATVVVFEKSRGIGGRLATRRAGVHSFDHGCTCLEVKSDAGTARLVAFFAAGSAVPWHPAAARKIDGGPLTPVAFDGVVGIPGMSGLVSPFADELDIRKGMTVGSLAEEEKGVRLLSDSGEDLGLFAAVVLAVPVPQAVKLLGERASLFPALAGIDYAPQWALMLACADRLPVEADVIDFTEGPLLRAVRDGAKPGRSGETWVVHSSADFARARLEDAPDTVAPDLVAAFSAATGLAIRPEHAVAHRWRYARPVAPLDIGFVFDPLARIAVTGDGLSGGEALGAMAGGEALATAMLAA